MKLSKKVYLHTFTIIVLILGAYRLLTQTSSDNTGTSKEKFELTEQSKISQVAAQDSTGTNCISTQKNENIKEIYDTRKPHSIRSVPRYDDTFPDANDIQLTAATKWGVKPVKDLEDAENRKSELVYVSSSPWFHVDNLRSSIPYLVPRAAILLQDIGKNFFDSLDVKGVPLHKIIATSILRTKENVTKLRTRNLNATENSCHLYGTTFDICYNRYKTVESPNGPQRRAVTNDTLKWVLSEVLRDMRESGRCYIKYEVKQGCFHITTR